MSALTLASLIALLVVALAARWGQGSWFAPGAFFAGFWALASGLPVLLDRALVVSDWALISILAFVCAFVIGTVLAARFANAARSLPTVRRDEGVSARLMVGTAIGGFAGLLAVYVLITSTGRSLADVFSLSEWLSLAVEMAVARYRESYIEPLSVRFLMALNYSGALLAGALLWESKMRLARITAFLPILSGIAMCAVTTAKMTFLVPIIHTLVAYLAVRYWRTGTAPKVGSIRALAVSVGAIVFVSALFWLSLTTRYGSEYLSESSFMFNRLSGYLFGHVEAYSAWVDYGGLWNVDATLGAYSLAGVMQVLGLHDRIAGLYEGLAFNDYTIDSNVFTVFRGLVEDVTFPGALASLAILGWLFGFAYGRARFSESAVWTATLAAFYAFTLWSPISNLFGYNTIIFAFVVFYSFFLLSRRQSR